MRFVSLLVVSVGMSAESLVGYVVDIDLRCLSPASAAVDDTVVRYYCSQVCCSGSSVDSAVMVECWDWPTALWLPHCSHSAVHGPPLGVVQQRWYSDSSGLLRLLHIAEQQYHHSDNSELVVVGIVPDQ